MLALIINLNPNILWCGATTKSLGCVCSQETWIQIPTSLLTFYVTLYKLMND